MADEDVSEVRDVGPGLALVLDGEVRLGMVQRDVAGFWIATTDSGRHLGSRNDRDGAVALLEAFTPQASQHGATGGTEGS